ncbi:hypothetical protein M413DRAFT_442334 [Hebeloma cylindrosporum]|uniref:Uncharacterized protein n=1 Tax=Hebeloma cylindrosporum TaxID=76867 RepID=A0A0C2Y790_HEBCY|nr:hypothetical protein M413DRAFT_442334 [Hebeloma cylindrosporum h7]
MAGDRSMLVVEGVLSYTPRNWIEKEIGSVTGSGFIPSPEYRYRTSLGPGAAPRDR